MKNQVYYSVESPNYSRTTYRLSDSEAMADLGWDGRFKGVIVETIGDLVITKVEFYYGCLSEDRSQAFQDRHVYLTKWSEEENN